MKYVFGAIIIILLLLSAYLEITKSSLESQLAQSEMDATALVAANKNYYSQTVAANKALIDAQKAAEDRQKQADDAVNAAMMTAKQYQLYAQKLSAKKPADKDDCKAANDLLNDYLVHQ